MHICTENNIFNGYARTVIIDYLHMRAHGSAVAAPKQLNQGLDWSRECLKKHMVDERTMKLRVLHSRAFGHLWGTLFLLQACIRDVCLKSRGLGRYFFGTQVSLVLNETFNN